MASSRARLRIHVKYSYLRPRATVDRGQEITGRRLYA